MSETVSRAWRAWIGAAWRRRSDLLLAVALVAVALFVARAASVAALAGDHPGSPDSAANLLSARSWIEGQAGAIGVIEHHHRPQTLPTISPLRPPGLPLLFAPWLALAPDAGPVVSVWFNAAVILLAAALLGWLLFELSGSSSSARLGFALAILGGHYQLVHLWNNNVLVAVSLASVLLVVRAGKAPRDAAGSRPVGAGVVQAGVWFAGVACKPTMLALVVVTGVAHAWRVRGLTDATAARRQLFVALGVFAVLVAGLVAWNLASFGRPSPQPVGIVLWAKYGLQELHPHTVHFASEPTLGSGLAEVVRRHGATWPLRHELAVAARTLRTVAAELGWLCIPLAAALVIAFRRENRAAWLLLLAGTVSVVDVAAAKLELRYGYPLLFALTGLAVLGARQLWLRYRDDARLRAGVAVALAGSFALAGVFAALGFRQQWHADLGNAALGAPPQVSLARSVPAGGVLLSDLEARRLSWWTRAASLQAPRYSPPSEVQAVCRHYRVGYYLTHKNDAELAAYLGDGVGFEVLAAQDDWRLVGLQTPAGTGI